jgi:hypothetical protein
MPTENFKGTINIPGSSTGATSLASAISDAGDHTVTCPAKDGTVAMTSDVTSGIVRSTRTSDTILAAADNGTLIDVTSGTFTQTFTAAATLGSGWYCYYRVPAATYAASTLFDAALTTLGSDVVVNGGFTSDVSWTKGTGWTISDNKASFYDSASGYASLTATTPPLTIGTFYKITYTMTVSTGNLTLIAGGVTLPGKTTGSYTYYFTPTATSLIVTPISDTSGSVTNIVIQQYGIETITALTTGNRYRMTWTLTSISSGAASPQLGTQKMPAKSAGTYIDEFAATAAHTALSVVPNSVGYITSIAMGNVKLEELTESLVTLNPDGAETIDGLTSYPMYPGETRLIQCDGSGFNTIVLTPFYKVFISSGTFTKPPGYSVFNALLWSGGASGGKHTLSSTSYYGGAGGGCFLFHLASSLFGATETITIGAGGISETVNTTAGHTGGDTSIGSLATVYAGNSAAEGGSVIDGAVVSTANDTGNFEGGGTVNTGPVNSVWGGSAADADATLASGISIYGGAAGGSHDGSNLRAAGTSKYGGNGGAASVTRNGVDGTPPAGGGGMAKNDFGNSGAGARGEVRIWGVI